MPEPSERMCCESTTDDYHAHGCADDGPTGPGPGFDVLPPAPDLQALKAEIDAAVRAEPSVLPVDLAKPQDRPRSLREILFSHRALAAATAIWVSPGDVAWFQKRHGELSPKRPLLTDPDSAALESEMMATVEQAFALKNKAGVGPTKRLISNIYREGLTVCAELNEVAHGLRELRSSSTMPETNFDELPNAKDWARRIEIWDEQNPVLAAFLDKLAQTDV